MRKVELVNIMNITGYSPSLSPQTLDLAKKIESGEVRIEDLPPVRLKLNSDGAFILTDGRHRITAIRLVGKTKIKGRYFKK